jgi:hypothetical protein
MEYTEKLTELIKGKLGDLDQQSMFSELAADGELRSEYKCIASVSDSIKSNINTFAPSSALKASVYSKAGVAMSTASTAVVVPVKVGFFKGAGWSYVVTGILATSLTVLTMLTFFMPDGLSNQVSTLQSQNDQSIASNQAGGTNNINGNYSENTQNQGQFANNIPVVSSGQKQTKSQSGTSYSVDKENENVLVSILDENDVANVNDNSGSEEMNEKTIIALSNSTIEYKNQEIDQRVDTQIESSVHRNIPMDIDQGFSINLDGFSTQLRSIASWHIPEAGINPEQFNAFNNSELAVNYQMKNDLVVGVSLRQETFYTEYIHEQTDGVYKYSSQPNFTTFSVNARYKFFEIKDLSFESAMGIGINLGGFVARPSLGLEFQAYDNLAFNIGFEYSYLWFKHQGGWFEARKTGLYYGLSYQF